MLRNVVLKIPYLAVLTFLMILTAESTRACITPTFRFGLERWPAGNYELIVFHKGPMSQEDTSIVKNLKKPSDEHLSHANFTVHTVDVSGKMPDWLQYLWKSLKALELPLLVVRHPQTIKSYRGSIWSGRLSEDAVRRVLDSPARQEIAKRIIDGDVAVWVLVESGNPAKDDAAAELISEQLSIMENELTFSPEFMDEIVDIVDDQEISIKFSLIRVSRDDPAEEVFINMLMYAEPGLLELQSSPMVFPVFTRGRALEALVGKGIKEKFIREDCEFVINACGCEIKEDNPGVDLLIAADWEAGLGKSWIDEEIPLVGLTTMSTTKNDKSSDLTTSASVNHESGVNTTSNKLLRNILITILAILVFVTAISLFLKLRRKER